MSVIKLSIEELSRLINIYEDLMKQLSRETGGYDYLRGLLNQVEKVNVTKDLNQLGTIENTHQELYNSLRRTKESLGDAIRTYKEQEKAINNMISRNFSEANLDQATINREFEKLEKSFLSENNNMSDREKIEFLQLMKPDENGYLTNVDLGGVNYEKIKVTKIEEDGIITETYIDEVNNTVLYMSISNPQGEKFEYGKLWTDNPLLLEEIRKMEIAALEKQAPDDMAPGDALKLQNVMLNGQIYSEIEVKCTAGGQWDEHKFVTFTDPKTGKILHNIDYTCSQDTLMRLKAVGLQPGEKIEYTERVSAGVYAFDETSFWDDFKGIFTGLLYYGMENIIDITTLACALGATILFGPSELLGEGETGSTMEAISKIILGADDIKNNLRNEMMKGVPGGSFNGGRALGFGIDMLIAVGTMGASLAGKEALAKSLRKIAPELTEAQSKAIIKSALKYMKESEIEDLIAKGNLDSILSKLPKSKTFKILNPELASKIDSLVRKKSFDAFSQVGIVYKDPLEIAIKENMKLKGRIEELLKVKGFENGLNKLTDADLQALIKRLSELDKNQFNDAIKALETGGKTDIDEINKVLKGVSNTNLFKVNESALNHSSIGDFTYNPKTGKVSKMKGGGHGQANIEFLETNGLNYEIVDTYPNGVRVGNVADHKVKGKRTGTNQSWFPESWSENDITKAGEYIGNLKENINAVDGVISYGEINGVRVGVIKTNGQISTIFPDATMQP